MGFLLSLSASHLNAGLVRCTLGCIKIQTSWKRSRFNTRPEVRCTLITKSLS
jgi:hypothetical protein